jgi:hypothetical protein
VWIDKTRLSLCLKTGRTHTIQSMDVVLCNPPAKRDAWAFQAACHHTHVGAPVMLLGNC